MLIDILYGMSLKKKLSIIFGVLILGTLMGVTIGVTAFSRVQVGGKAYGVIEQNMLVADNIAKLRANMAFSRAALLSMIIEDNADTRQELKDTLATLATRIDEIFDTIDGQLKTSNQAEVVTILAPAREAWNAFRETRDKELIPLILAGKTKQAMVIARGVQSERYNSFDASTKEAVDHVRDENQPLVAQIKRESNIIQWSFIVASGCLVVFLIVVALFLSKTIISPIVLVTDRSHQMAQGDFTRASIRGRNRDEIGRLIDNFSAMSGKVGEIVSHIKVSIMSLTSSSDELSTTAENLNKGAEDQARQSKQVTEATKQMSQTTMDIAQNTGQAADAAKNSSMTASEGKKIVEATAERLVSIRESVKEAMQTIEELSQSSGQIGEIVNLIHSIADQTNLLALNAAIEAARAGEQGRGFAVVAEEVRKLADKTTNATKDIDKKITAIQSESEKSLITIRKGNEEIEKGMELAKSASEALNSIVKASTQVMDMVQRVAAATEEQSASSEEIMRNMNSISEVIENASSATGRIKQAAHGLATLSAEIRGMIDWFKTETAAGTDSTIHSK